MCTAYGIARPDWRQLIADGHNDIADLRYVLHIPPEDIGKLKEVQATYPMFVNPYYLSLVSASDAEDPIRRMCVPGIEELDHAGSEDTSGEASSTVLPGLQHKYPETALLIASNRCATLCRHCFRRRFVGLSQDEVVRDVDAAADYIRRHREITNVLVTGGDPFMLENREIRRYLEALSPIGHIRTVRFGTRVPVVLPQRITSDDELVVTLAEFNRRKQIHIVTQFNHPREITPEARKAVKTLFCAGIPARNQTVLLAGVNDDPETLAALMDGLVSMGVAPYYVFQCRPVVGVKNRFQVPLNEGYRIVEKARSRLSGLAKSFRYAMSHDMGKIEVIGPVPEPLQVSAEPGTTTMLFKFHQARERSDLGRIFMAQAPAGSCWLDRCDIPPA